MNTLIVEFHGICVHFSRELNPSLGLPAPHRVVIPFVTEPIPWLGKTIQIHAPYMAIQTTASAVPEQSVPVGVTLALDPLPEPLGVSGFLPCAVPLKAIYPDMILNTAVVMEQQSPAAAYFDIHQGTLSNINIEGSAATRLTIETAATEAWLTKTRWDGVVERVRISLQESPPAVILMSNIAKAKDDQLDDFILNFAVATHFPPPHDIQPKMLEMLEGVTNCLISTTGDLGPGCSNSTFP
ncbi:MAG TPA: hypothetical protein VKB93_22145 [Thermoanaerobaculia bacterium]|nr:hypothetical protein [Thermoanaerobaculia bacterium]